MIIITLNETPIYVNALPSQNPTDWFLVVKAIVAALEEQGDHSWG